MERGYGRSFIYRDNANWEVQRTNHFEVWIDALNDDTASKVGNGEGINEIWSHNRPQLKYGGAQNNSPKTDIGLYSDARQAFRMAVKSTFLPTNNIDTAEIKHGNETVKVATAYSVDGGSISCQDAIAANIERLLWAWFNQVINVDTMLMGLVVDYKKTVKLIQYSPDGTIARYWECYGAFPTSMNSGDLSYDGGDLKEVTMDLSIDLAVPKIYDNMESDPQAFTERLVF